MARKDPNDLADYRVSMKLRRSLGARLEAYMNAQPVTPDKTAVMSHALDAFLNEQGFTAEEEKPAAAPAW